MMIVNGAIKSTVPAETLNCCWIFAAIACLSITSGPSTAYSPRNTAADHDSQQHGQAQIVSPMLPAKDIAADADAVYPAVNHRWHDERQLIDAIGQPTGCPQRDLRHDDRQRQDKQCN